MFNNTFDSVIIEFEFRMQVFRTLQIPTPDQTSFELSPHWTPNINERPSKIAIKPVKKECGAG